MALGKSPIGTVPAAIPITWLTAFKIIHTIRYRVTMRASAHLPDRSHVSSSGMTPSLLDSEKPIPFHSGFAYSSFQSSV